MSHFFQQIEAALLPVAIPYTPEGTDPRAVVHQWMHAVANNSELVGKVDAAGIIDFLKTAGIFKSEEQFI